MCSSDSALKNGRNFADAIIWWERAAKGDNLEAQNALGVAYFKGFGVEQDYEVAVNWFNRAAERGFSESQINLAAMHENGRGTKKNRVEAYK